MSNRFGGQAVGTNYRGNNAQNPPNVTYHNDDPTQYDSQNFSIGDRWINNADPTNVRFWELGSLAGNSVSKGMLAHWYLIDTSGGGGDLNTITSNSGGAIGPDAMENINVVGDGTTITGVGVPATNTITFTATNSGNARTFTLDDAAVVVPDAMGNINFGGVSNIATSSPGANTMQVALTGITEHSLQVGGAADTLTQLGVATDGQIPIGSTGSDPVLATLTAGAGISIVNGAGTITISAVGGGGVVNNIYNQVVGSSFTNAVYVVNPFLGTTQSIVETSSRPTVAPIAGTFSGLGADVYTNNSTSSDTITLYVNGAPTALTITITALTTGIFQDAVNTVAVAQGDSIEFLISQSTTSTFAAKLSWVFTA